MRERLADTPLVVARKHLSAARCDSGRSCERGFRVPRTRTFRPNAVRHPGRTDRHTARRRFPVDVGRARRAAQAPRHRGLELHRSCSSLGRRSLRQSAPRRGASEREACTETGRGAQRRDQIREAAGPSRRNVRASPRCSVPPPTRARRASEGTRRYQGGHDLTPPGPTASPLPRGRMVSALTPPNSTTSTLRRHR